MLSEERVKLMTKMASYENKQGAKDFEISAYFRNDYAGLHVIATLLWVTVGYIVAAVLVLLPFVEGLIRHFRFRTIVVLGIGAVVGYIVVLILYGCISSAISKKRHDAARERVKQYNRDLSLLKKLYKKEKR